MALFAGAMRVGLREAPGYSHLPEGRWQPELPQELKLLLPRAAAVCRIRNKRYHLAINVACDKHHD
jgi:hypothetical protein